MNYFEIGRSSVHNRLMISLMTIYVLRSVGLKLLKFELPNVQLTVVNCIYSCWSK